MRTPLYLLHYYQIWNIWQKLIFAFYECSHPCLRFSTCTYIYFSLSHNLLPLRWKKANAAVSITQVLLTPNCKAILKLQQQSLKSIKKYHYFSLSLCPIFYIKHLLFSFPKLYSKFQKIFKQKGFCILVAFSFVNFYVSFLLGFVNWNNKTFSRATEKYAFKKWQPNIYNTIKDYDDNFGNEEMNYYLIYFVRFHRYLIFPILHVLLVEIRMSVIRNLKT